MKPKPERTYRNQIDVETLKLKMIPPFNHKERPDKRPLSPNPIRRFRDELHLTREEFAALIGTKVQTIKTWEFDVEPCAPRGEMMMKIVELARRNNYPFFIEDVYDFVAKTAKR
jgi:DNA-binding transcriptional regulator YiaG